MNIVILGAGRVGQQLARQLISEKKEVVIIEKDSNKAQDVSRQLDCLVINTNGNSMEALRKAGVEKADYFIAVTESDEINMISSALVSSSYNRPQTIARVRNVDYSNTWDNSPGFLGINYIINPEVEVARAIVRAVEFGAVSSVIDFETTKLQMRSVPVEAQSILDGKKLEELKDFLGLPFIIAVISRQNEMFIPNGMTILQPEDHIWIIADSEDFGTLLDKLNKPQLFMRNILIAGGGNIGMYIAQHLTENNQKKVRFFSKMLSKVVKTRKRNIHMVEESYQRCKELAEIFPNIQITNADITEEQVFEEGRFQSYDLIITATGNQDLNIVTAAHGRKEGIKRSLALVKRESSARIARDVGVDAAISINETLVNSIQKIIRQNYARSVHSFSDSNLEILELAINRKPEYIGKAIRDIKLPGKSLILMITREDDNFIPNGDFVLEQEDNLMIISSKDSIREFE